MLPERTLFRMEEEAGAGGGFLGPSANFCFFEAEYDVEAEEDEDVDGGSLDDVEEAAASADNFRFHPFDLCDDC